MMNQLDTLHYLLAFCQPDDEDNPDYEYTLEELKSEIQLLIMLHERKVKLINPCPECGAELLWGGDDSYEDYSLEGDGIVTNATCKNEDCNVEDILIYKTLKI